MRAVDFFFIMLCCLCWGGNFVVSSWALAGSDIPPFMLAFIRSCIVLLVMFPFLRKPLPKDWFIFLVMCACVGAMHLALLYTGLKTAPASASSIVAQMLIPFAAILSVIFLRERIGWVRGSAIIGALIGVVIMIYDPETFRLDIGLVWILLAYFVLAVASVLMKKVGDVDWRHYVAWVAVLVFVLMGAASFLFETGQAQVWREDKGPLLIAAGYAAIAVSVVAHGQYFQIIRKYDVSQVVPLTLMTTVFACVLGVIFLNDRLYPRYIIGAALILPCVYLIAKRQKSAVIAEE